MLKKAFAALKQSEVARPLRRGGVPLLGPTFDFNLFEGQPSSFQYIQMRNIIRGAAEGEGAEGLQLRSKSKKRYLAKKKRHRRSSGSTTISARNP